MKYALNQGENGRILSVTFEKYATESMTLVDTLPDGKISDYLYVDGEFIYDPLPVTNYIRPEKKTHEIIAELEAENAKLKEETAMLLDCILEMSEIVYA